MNEISLLLDDHYIDNLKLLYEDKVAYEKDLRYKAEDLLVGRSPSDWLPKIDLALPRVGYEEIDVLSKAPDSVKRIFRYGQPCVLVIYFIFTSNLADNQCFDNLTYDKHQNREEV